MSVQGVTGSDLHALTSLSQPRNPQSIEAPGKADTAVLAEVKQKVVSEQEAPVEQTTKAKPELERIPGSDRAGTRFGIDKATDRMVAQIMDHDQEVIKQIPPENLLKVLGRQRRLQGMLFDESV